MSIEAEKTAVTKATVAPGLGYPNHRQEESSEPVGWNALQTLTAGEVSEVKAFPSESDVSRETSR